MDHPNKFDYGPPPSVEDRLQAQLLSKRRVISSWTARARALGFDSVAHMLEVLEESGARVKWIPRFAKGSSDPTPAGKEP